MSTPGILAALAAALSWALASIAIGRVLDQGRITPAAANLSKNGLAAASFFVAALVFGGRWPVGDAWGWLLASGFLGFAVADTLYFAAFRRCGVQAAATVMLLNVPIATLLAVPLAGDSIRLQVLPFMAVVLVGVLLVILDSRAARVLPSKLRASVTPRPGRSFAFGVLLAVAAAFAIGTAVPLGRGRFDDVGVCPGGFIRLFAGALGALPLAALSGFRRGSSSGAEVDRLLQPLFTAPGPGSVWGRLPLVGVGCAILGLVPYHFALRELPGGVSALLFASTPLFTLPIALLLGQRIGWLAVVGTLTGFVGVGGILLRSEAPSLPRHPAPLIEALEFESPEGARLPTFVVGGELAERSGGCVARPVLAVAPHREDIDRFRLTLIGSIGAALGSQRDLVEESLGDDSAVGTDGGTDGGTTAATTGEAAGSGRFFVNWADVPRAAELATGGGLVAAHLERIGDATYAYGVRLTLEEDGPPGRDVGWLHEDRAPVEHGFVSIVPEPDGGAAFAWLDGRTSIAPGGTHLFARKLRADGALQPEVLLDERVCDCCPTDAARLDDGTLVVVYRDRSLDEVRDIACVRLSRAGERLGDPVIVNDDGWRIEGCPVNGPSVAVSGRTIAVAWFTQPGASERAEVRVAFSTDGGRSFGAPQRVSTTGTLGRVEIAPFEGPSRSGSPAFVVVHLALDDQQTDQGFASWEAVTVSPHAEPSEGSAIARVDAARRSGAIDLIPSGDGTVDAVWVGRQRIEAARIRRSAGAAPSLPD